MKCWTNDDVHYSSYRFFQLCLWGLASLIKKVHKNVGRFIKNCLSRKGSTRKGTGYHSSLCHGLECLEVQHLIFLLPKRTILPSVCAGMLSEVAKIIFDWFSHMLQKVTHIMVSHAHISEEIFFSSFTTKNTCDNCFIR